MTERTEERKQFEESKQGRLIAFGFDVQSWLASPIGRYLTVRANEEIQACRVELGEIDVKDTDGIVNLQRRIKICQQWQDWLREAVQVGKATEDAAIENDT